MAYASVWITVASILAAFEITKAVDVDGMIIEPNDKVRPGIVWYVTCLFQNLRWADEQFCKSIPEDFKCSIKPRSKEAEVLICSSKE